jgi:hypothetical protein
MFYDKGKFRDMLRDVGFSRVDSFPHKAENYLNRRFRFNVLATK